MAAAPRAATAAARPGGDAGAMAGETGGTGALTGVTGSIDEILALLAAQATTYAQLYTIAEARHAALVAADVDRLGELAAREQPLLARARKLEDARLEVLRPWAARLGVQVEQVTISGLCGLLDTDTAARLVAARDRLHATVMRLNESNARNAGLLQACIDSINASVQQLLEAIQFDPRYASNGNRLESSAGPRLTDYRA